MCRESSISFRESVIHAEFSQRSDNCTLLLRANVTLNMELRCARNMTGPRDCERAFFGRKTRMEYWWKKWWVCAACWIHKLRLHRSMFDKNMTFIYLIVWKISFYACYCGWVTSIAVQCLLNFLYSHTCEFNIYILFRLAYK